MGVSKRPGRERRPDPEAQPSPYESGVIEKDLPEQTAPDGAPPWPVVHAYLESGAHRLWVEGWATRSPAFADVLAALRNDHEERTRPDPDGVVLPIKR
jgi:hypothetical protein